jgi:alkaline phosphatase
MHFIPFNTHALSCFIRNDPASQYYEILEYQRTVESVMKFVEKNPNTILISTSDHETGGLTVGRQVTEDYPKYEWKPEVIERVKVSSEVLSWVWSEAVQNKQDTREYLVNFVIKLGLGIDDPTEEELERLLAWKETGRGPEYFALILSDLVSKRAQIGVIIRRYMLLLDHSK